jgi:hypothetical protein
MDLAALKTEIDGDPEGLGYSGKTDQAVADLMNTIGLSSETITRESVNTADIIVAIFSDVTEFNSLSDSEIMKLNLLSPVGTIDPTTLQAVFINMFPAGGGGRPNIRAALIALATRSASRAEALLGESVSLLDVHRARRL